MTETMSQQSDNQMVSAYGRFQLDRYPLRNREDLRAWDAADEYLLGYLHKRSEPASARRVLILNDNFGGVAVPLATTEPVVQTDSFIAHWSIQANLECNGLSPEAVRIYPSTLDEKEQHYDLVLIRIPKALALLEHQLCHIRRVCDASTTIIGFAMAKQIHRSTLTLFSDIIGPTQTSLAKKKARLVFSAIDSELPTKSSPYPGWYELPQQSLRVCSHANVFSRGKLDIGTRLLLNHLPSDAGYQDIVDLGCGSGVIGVIAAQLNPQARVHFVDESYMAVASAEATAKAAGIANQTLFRVGDGLRDYEKQSVDLVLCNPPFHQQHAVGDFIAWRLFQQSRQALRRGGELWIVGNRHLNYHVKLKRLFSRVEQVTGDRKFVVLRAIKS